MTTKTDKLNEVGMHVFERAGLGVAPFRFVGCFEKFFQATPDAPRQCGGCCKFCGTGIVIHCTIQDRNGVTFNVGSDCVAKTGDAGLIQSFKRSPQARAHAKKLRDARADRVRAEWNALWSDPATSAKLDGKTVQWKRWNGEIITRTVEEEFKRVWAMCGAAGEARQLKALKKALGA